MSPARTLTPHEFHQRQMQLWSRLERSGDVLRATDDAVGSHRLLRLEVAVPGWGLPLAATLVFVERYELRRNAWELTGYKYEYHREPRPSGRKAYHWHDGLLHIHCDDPRSPRAERHFRAVQVDLLEVADEFRAIHLRNEIDCAGLFALA